MQKKKDEKNFKIMITVLVVVLLVWFLVVSPILKFKSMEKNMLEATKRYFEINESKLPTGTKIKKVSLQTLYKQDFIKEDLRAPYTNKYCESDESWARVRKINGEYEYNVYLKCGMFKSKIDHEGPTITLKGNDEVVVYQGNAYEDEGIKSVIDDSDGKMSINDVTVDTSKVNVNKIGTYEVTYTAKDSLENKTVKIRKVKVTQTLNNIIKEDTGKTKIYQGNQNNNYVKLDGILFQMIGINEDNSVKVVSKEALGSVDYEGINSWLNDYFYEKLSNSAKDYIKKDSKWCIDSVKNPDEYKKCTNYSKKNPIGLLSILDYNNSKDSDGVSNIVNDTAVWTSNSKTDKKTAWVSSYFDIANSNFSNYKEFSNNKIFNIKPALNITENATVIAGDGSSSNPYILKGNKNTSKKGNKISNVNTGSYISYSGYLWRVIEKENDETTKVIMTEPVKNNGEGYYTKYDSKLTPYNPTRKNNVAYKIVNQISESIKTTYFVSKAITVNTYNDYVLYNQEKNTKKYNVKLSLASVFDLYSANTTNGVSTWYQEISKDSVYINSATLGITSNKFDSEETNGIRLVGYLDKNIVIKNGEGSETNPYTITK